MIRQLHLGPIDLSSYSHRNTRANHFNEILETFRYQLFGSNGNQEQLIEYLVNLSLENDDSTFLMKETLDFLTCNRIIFPSIATLEDVISHCRSKAESTLFSILLQPLTGTQIEKLDDFLHIFKEKKMTKLAWLKDIPGKANPESFMSICKKVEAINAIELGTINVAHIHRNRFLQLARLGDNYDAYDFSRFEFEKKYALLIAFLVDHHQYLIDQLIEINDRGSSPLILGKLGSYARKNKVATALRELGRIEKSIFMIRYVTDDQLCRKITHGLNKTEAVNALARELYFGRRGKFMECDIRRQLQSASALNVLINAISIWNAVYLQEAYNYLVKLDPQVTKYMRHISPINWEHITFLGE